MKEHGTPMCGYVLMVILSYNFRVSPYAMIVDHMFVSKVGRRKLCDYQDVQGVIRRMVMILLNILQVCLDKSIV